MASVTIVGSGSQKLSMSFDATANYALAKQIADQINSGVAGGSIGATPSNSSLGLK